MAKENKQKQAPHTVNQAEINRFSALASRWWDKNGPMAPLHKLNPVRLGYINQQIEEYYKEKKGSFAPNERHVLDIGCAAGLVAEPLAQMGYKVSGIDASTDLIAAAQQHAREHAPTKNLNYQCTDTSALIKEKKQFDVVLALEVIEHVNHQKDFVADCAKLLKKDGLLIMSTLNRSAKGFLLGIVGAEYILRWLPRGTHDWRAFVKPSELSAWMTEQQLIIRDVSGLKYHPLRDQFSIDAQDVDVNYLITSSH